ncbi:MAG: preprotein translocase subunit SecY [Bacteroidetes bacterium]|nr:preprotein translocase subunit SecY [Bacteroidota bacterium]
MKKFVQKLKEIWSIEELRAKIKATLLFLLVYRIGTFIILPGIDGNVLMGALKDQTDGILGLVNVFAGGAFGRGAIFALGIMPYISASIVIQLLTIAVPAFQKMQKEGEDGRRKINQYTRLLTIAITAVQAVAYLYNITSKSDNWGALLFKTNPAEMSESFFMIVNVTLLVAGTMFTMWLGERITDKGLGNGISLIIMVGIIDRLPEALGFELDQRITKGGLPLFIVELIFWLIVIVTTILLIQGTRKITVNYAKRVEGSRVLGGARQYIPLKVNAAGVMPIIFAQAIMFIPPTISQSMDTPSSFLRALSDYGSLWYNLVFAILIIAFTYFYTAITVNPNQMAEEMKKSGGFIPGIKPGKSTSDYIDEVLSRITLPGALFLAGVAVLPSIAMLFGIDQNFAQFFGGTSLLIMVGVVLDTLQQIESHLLMRHYDGLMKSGRIKGRTGVTTQSI